MALRSVNPKALGIQAITFSEEGYLNPPNHQSPSDKVLGSRGMVPPSVFGSQANACGMHAECHAHSLQRAAAEGRNQLPEPLDQMEVAKCLATSPNPPEQQRMDCTIRIQPDLMSPSAKPCKTSSTSVVNSGSFCFFSFGIVEGDEPYSGPHETCFPDGLRPGTWNSPFLTVDAL